MMAGFAELRSEREIRLPHHEDDAQASRRAWAAMVLHQVRQPLTVIAGYGRLMQRRGTYDAQTMSQLIGATQRLGRIMDELLDVARLDADEGTLHWAPVDLVAVAQVHVDGARAITDQHTVRLMTNGRPVMGWWDAERVGDVLSNLLGNAIKYAPDGGEIDCRIQGGGVEARVSVSDRGLGIPPAALPLLFAPFQRAENAVESGVEGVGLGLFIARTVVEAHGGRIWAESKLGHGSTFTFTLPYQPGRVMLPRTLPH